MSNQNYFTRIILFILLIVSLFAIAFVFGSLLGEEQNAWVQMKGPNNGIINIVGIDSINPDILYAIDAEGGILKTTDRGNTWNEVSAGHTFFDELVVSPKDPEKIWIVDGVDKVFETTDGGSTWDQIIDPYGDGFRFGSVYALAPAPSDPDTIYALKNGFGIFKSIDSGDSWRFLEQSEVDYTYSIAVDPTDPDVVYSGYNPKPSQDWAMVRQTIDGGESWRTALMVPNSNGITSLAIDPNNPETIYAGSRGEVGEIYKSTDTGNSWSTLNEHFTMCTVWGQPQLIVDPNDTSIAYVATWLGGTWKTIDAGETWTLLRDVPVSSTALSLNPLNSNVIYSADRTEPKLWKTTNAGSSWEEIADFSGDGAFMVNRVLADGDTIYVATFGPDLHGGKLYKSEDSGSTWTDISSTLPRAVLDVAVDQTNRDTLYITLHPHGANKSIDGGKTWIELENFPNIGAYDIEVDPVDPTILYACGAGGFWVPDWCREPEGYTFNDGSGVYKSTDSGLTWVKILKTSNECRAIRIHPSDHNVLFAAAMDDGLQISTDGGNSWTTHNTGLDTNVLTSCAVSNEKIYVGTQGCGVYSGKVDTDQWSVVWQPDLSNKPVPEVYSLLIGVDPMNSNRIFVGACPGGLYRSDDGGSTFYDKNFLTPSVISDDPLRQGFYTFALNPNDTNEVWLGTWGKGLYKSYDGMDFGIGAHGKPFSMRWWAMLGTKDFDIGANIADMKIYGTHINQIAIDPKPPHAVYVATEEGIFKTIDDGATWIDFNNGLDTPQIRTISITSDGKLLCGSLGYELYYYDATDERWVQMNAFGNLSAIQNDRPIYPYTSLLFHPIEPDLIYFGTSYAGIYKSTDGDQSWREINVDRTKDGVLSLVFHPENPNTLYAGTYNGISRSMDGGAHWEMLDQGWPASQCVFSIAFDPVDPNVMYACSKNGGISLVGFHGTVMKSTDGGSSWFSINNELNLDQEFYKIMVDKYDNDTLYLATQKEGVFISRNGGDSWLTWNEGLTNLGTAGNKVSNTMVQSVDGKYIYFNSAESGVFRRISASADADKT
ncbi:WD40/YVTN/BNR-like repeat-containing protein [Halobacteriota archaeon]